MPWTPDEFKAKHWKGANPRQAAKASSIASAMIEAGAPEGTAIATGIARAKGSKKRSLQELVHNGRKA